MINASLLCFLMQPQPCVIEPTVIVGPRFSEGRSHGIKVTVKDKRTVIQLEVADQTWPANRTQFVGKIAQRRYAKATVTFKF